MSLGGGFESKLEFEFEFEDEAGVNVRVWREDVEASVSKLARTMWRCKAENCGSQRRESMYWF